MNTYTATWTARVSALSSAVVASLALNDLPPLCVNIDGSPGGILLGPQYVAEHGSPPRIVMIPKGGDVTDIDMSSYMTPPTPPITDPDQVAEHLNPAIVTLWKSFTVQCWGCWFDSSGNPAPDPAKDYDAAQALCELVWQQAQEIAAGCWRSKRLEIDKGAPKLARIGRIFAFDLALSTPVTRHYYPAETGPNPTVAQPTVELNGDFGPQPA